jgi:hypothetical protein
VHTFPPIRPRWYMHCEEEVVEVVEKEEKEEEEEEKRNSR